jgi:hypothetical protein
MTIINLGYPKLIPGGSNNTNKMFKLNCTK